MLNTDLHSRNIKAERKMRLEQFIKNLRGKNDWFTLIIRRKCAIGTTLFFFFLRARSPGCGHVDFPNVNTAGAKEYNESFTITAGY